MGSNSGSHDGLKFGLGIGAGPPARPTRKGSGPGGGGGPGGGQPPRCQVEGCKVDLSDAKAYYSRHKVCGMHSKSPMVVVSGLQQRFCQQCSRFHQLSEFDQGKRSCRRRLAGHNERRRKPPPGTLMSSRLGRLSSSRFGDGISWSGGILLDFSSYSRDSGKDPWVDTKPSERVPGCQSASAGKSIQSLWPGNSSEDPASEMFLQGSSAGGSSFTIPSGECITGVSSDSSCALSLLSNQTWGSRTRASGPTPDHPMGLDGATMSHSVTVAHLPGTSSSWGIKGNEAHLMQPDHLGLSQINQPVSGHFNGDLMMDQVNNGSRQYMELDHSRAYSSGAPGHVNWSL